MSFNIIHGDVLDVLRTMESESVHCVCTSPPYWGLRDYGTAQWDGGDVACDHKLPSRVDAVKATATSTLVGSKDSQGHLQEPSYRSVCGKCGARRVDRQIGLEPTPDAYVSKMVEVFREVRRVLRDDGTLWLNLGDSYSAHPGQRKTTDRVGPKQETNGGSNSTGSRSVEGLKPKDLIGIPWRVAFALQADGWWLRSDIIWHKPNPMPESVTDRPTKAHEYVFLMSKSERYRYDADAIKEPLSDANAQRTTAHYDTASRYGAGNGGNTGLDSLAARMRSGSHATRNKRTVWTLATLSTPDAHFATFPIELPETCLKAGCPEGGLVLDPFCGSGTTGLAALKNGRRFVGIELNESYIRIAHDRLMRHYPLLAQREASAS